MKVLKKHIENRVITKTLFLIKKFCGLSLKPCDYFTGIHRFAGRKYFNCMLNERCDSYSRELRVLERLVQKGIISKVEPNGLKRVAIFLTNNNKDMNKKEVIKMAEKYSGRTISQVDYMEGFQAACNIVRQKLETCYNADFCDAMEELAQVAYMDLSDDD